MTDFEIEIFLQIITNTKRYSSKLYSVRLELYLQKFFSLEL